jgi:hypothetical protein
MLDADSFSALYAEPSAGNHTIRIEPGLAAAELAGSAIPRAARTMLEYDR